MTIFTIAKDVILNTRFVRADARERLYQKSSFTHKISHANVDSQPKQTILTSSLSHATYLLQMCGTTRQRTNGLAQ